MGVDLVLTSDNTTWQHDAVFGVHDIEICLLNKQIDDTVLDDNGNIVSDMNVIIKSLIIDNIDFKNEIDVISLYKDNNGNPVKTFGFLGFGSPYKIFAQTPGYIFKKNLQMLAEEDVLIYLSDYYNK